MIEFVFAASPETIRREPQDFHVHRSVGHLQDLAACVIRVKHFSRSRSTIIPFFERECSRSRAVEM